MIITSAQNPRIKSIMALEKSRERKASGLFTVEGLQEVTHAVQAAYRIRTLVVCPEIAGDRHQHLLRSADEILQVSPEVFSRLVLREHSGGVMAVAEMKGHALEDIRLSDCPLILVVEAVEKPGNLGALLRIADGAGIDAVVICDPLIDVYNPNVIRSSVGCVFTVPVAVAGASQTIDWLKSLGVSVFATHLQASKPYDRVDFTKPCAIVMGTESTGLSSQWWSASDQNIIIPMRGRNDSLNVSTAAAVVVFEAVRQRQTENPAVHD